MPEVKDRRRVSTGAWIFFSALAVAGALLIIANMANSARQEEARIEAQNRQVREQIETSQASANSENYSRCLQDAYDSYSKQWDETARSVGNNEGKIPTSDAEFLDRRHSEAKDDCLKQYEATK